MRISMKALIAAVHERPILYDQTRTSFQDVSSKMRRWNEVAKIVYGNDDRTTVHRVKMQWKGLRDAFVKQQRKRKQFPTLRPYCYETDLQFLRPYIVSKRTGHEEEAFHTETEIKIEEPVIMNSSSPEEPQYASSSTDPLAEHIPPPPMEESSADHPVDAFFHGIAQTVKQLKPATIAKIKKAVANIIIDAEIEEIEAGP